MLNRSHIRRIVLVALASVLLAIAAALLYSWYQPYWRAQALATARAQWAGRPFERYHLEVAQDSRILTYTRFDSSYQVWDESLEIMQGDVQMLSVSAFFDWIERYPRSYEFTCGDLANDACRMPASYTVHVAYDEHLGYPQRIELVRTIHPEWFSPRFWLWYIQSREWSACSNPLCTETTRTLVTIESLEPLPE